MDWFTKIINFHKRHLSGLTLVNTTEDNILLQDKLMGPHALIKMKMGIKLKLT